MEKSLKSRILISAHNNLGVGGIQNVIMNTVRNLSDEFVFDIICFDSKRTDFDEEFKSFGGKIFRIEAKPPKKPLAKKIDFILNNKRIENAVKKIIKKNGPYQALHSHSGKKSGPILKAAKRCGIPIRIAHAHTAFGKPKSSVTKRYLQHLKKLTTKYATALVGCSDMAAKSVFGEDKNYTVIFNTVDERFLNYKAADTAHSSPTLLQIGLICDNKNQLFTVEVFSHLLKRYNNATLYIIGSPKDEEMEAYQRLLKLKVKELNAEGLVKFINTKADVIKEMENADYIIFPSKTEGLGIVPLEAQAIGIKCFVSSSVPHDIDCGGCVFLDLALGADVWAEKIAKEFSLNRGSRAAYDITPFLPEVITDKYRRLYKGELTL